MFFHIILYLLVSAHHYDIFFWLHSYVFQKDNFRFKQANLCFCPGPSRRLSRKAAKWHNFNAIIWRGPKRPGLTHLPQWPHPLLRGSRFPQGRQPSGWDNRGGILCKSGFGVCSNESCVTKCLDHKLLTSLSLSFITYTMWQEWFAQLSWFTMLCTSKTKILHIGNYSVYSSCYSIITRQTSYRLLPWRLLPA